jgi:hypothetical protein
MDDWCGGRATIRPLLDRLPEHDGHMGAMHLVGRNHPFFHR